ncbi:alpha/beta hydrolase [Verrucomicrobia bacterium]|nr:alpha/beta hydrolase [Verrucomicrobiota bacterium]|tara:strand:- start:3489 stop:5003 length:1515 start_codon:yes stop_codon:yes gene_type:complete
MIRKIKPVLTFKVLIFVLVTTIATSCSLPSRHAKAFNSKQELEAALIDSVSSKTKKIVSQRKVSSSLATLIESKDPTISETHLQWIGRKEIDPMSFSHVVRSNAVIRTNWSQEWHQSEGTGTPLILLKKTKDDRSINKIGETLPVTAVVKSTEKNPKILLYDLLDPKNDQAKVPEIARDYTAPINYLTRRTKLIPKVLAIINANRYMNRIGLRRMNPYDPNKIPIILIHGFKANPRAWVNLINQLQADPEIRNHYQFWTFSYPTGIPLHYSAMRLRKELQAMQKKYAPNGKNPNLQKIVLVGHSMGGILSRLMVSKNNKELPPWMPSPTNNSQLPNKPKDLAADMFIFKPQEYIGRVIFIATPHRGTKVASLKISRMINSIIRIPIEIQNSLLSGLRLNPDIPFEEATALMKLKSIDNVSPNSYLIRSLQSEKISTKVPFHSIIGIGKFSSKKPLTEATDLVVSYQSAHLKNAISELKVRAWHDLHKYNETITEVGEILKQHNK